MNNQFRTGIPIGSSVICLILLCLSLVSWGATAQATEVANPEPAHSAALVADHILYVDDGLIGRWRFNRNQNGMLIDASKNRNHGTLQAAAQITSITKLLLNNMGGQIFLPLVTK